MEPRGDDMGIDCGGVAVGLGMSFLTTTINNSSASSWNSTSNSSSAAIDSSNIGFQLLKKHGWKEGTGLGVSEQGRLEPVEAYMKKNKRGLGADKEKKSENAENHPNKTVKPTSKKRSKNVSKKLRKMQEFEKHLKEKEFERDFFREFWPDNV